MSEKPPIRDIFKSRKESKKRRESGDLWHLAYGDPLLMYEATFRGVLDKPLAEFLKERKESGKKVYALDLMGIGSPLEELPIDRGLACALRNPGVFPVDFVEGDVLSKETWENIKKWVREHTENQGFDLILCRPVGGGLSIPGDVGLCYFLINQMWQVANRDGGHIYTEVPHKLTQRKNFEKLLARWEKQLKGTGINSQHFYSDNEFLFKGYLLRLIRQSDNPSNLPTIKI